MLFHLQLRERVTTQERSRIRAHTSSLREKKILGLFQYIFLFVLYEFSSSYVHCKLNQ